MSQKMCKDITSPDSLSFSNLVCNQNQQSSPHARYIYPLLHSRHASSEFEFSMGTNALDDQSFSVEKLFAYNSYQPQGKGAFDSGEPDVNSGLKGEKITSERMNNRKSSGKKKNGSAGKGIGQKISIFSCKDCKTIESATLNRARSKGHMI